MQRQAERQALGLKLGNRRGFSIGFSRLDIFICKAEPPCNRMAAAAAVAPSDSGSLQ